MSEQHRSYIDLFAGCGGLSLGFHNAGWQGLFAIERDPMAFETFSANFLLPGSSYPDFQAWPHWLEKAPHDIRTLLGDRSVCEHLAGLRDTVTLVVGGPPCQGFSVGGSRNGVDDRNSLVDELLRVVDLVRPRAVLIENVEGMARRFQSKPNGSSQSVAGAVVEALETLGYSAAATVLVASFFGVPQVRRRLVIIGLDSTHFDVGVGFQDSVTVARTRLLAELGLPRDRFVTAKEAIGDLDGDERVPCPDSPGYLSGTYKGEPRSGIARLMRRGIPVHSVPDSHRLTKHGVRILSWYKLAHATQTPGRLSREFMRSLGTKKDKKVLVDADSPVSTITTHPDEFIHYRHPRNVTVREMARFQSFPDDFVFRGRYTINGPRRPFDVPRCSQVGNAVPPLLAQGIAYAIEALIERQTLPSPRVLGASSPQLPLGIPT